MGRTQATYRMRLNMIRDKLMRLYQGNRSEYKKCWQVAQQLSAPASTLPYSDTYAVATFSMILEAIAQIEEMKSE